MGNAQTVYSSQNSFQSGDVDPRFHDRYDLQLYKSFAQDTLNMYPILSGAMTRRPGTEYFGVSKDVNDNTRFLSFEFNNSDFLLLEFGATYVRFHKTTGTVSSGGSAYEVTTPYSSTEVQDLDFAQLNDVVFIVHPEYPPKRLRRIADDNWVLSDLTLRDGPYLSVNSSSTTLTLTGTDPIYTMTSTTSLFTANDVGRFVRVQIPTGDSAGLWFYGEITAYTSATEVTFESSVSTSASYISGDPADVWRLGAFYTDNYPEKVTFYQNRLVLAKTPSDPSSGWMSVTADDNYFAPTLRVSGSDEITTTSSISFTISANAAASIQFITGDNTFLVGTESGLFSSQTGTLTPANFSMFLSNNIPLASTSPVEVDGSIIAVSQLKNQVYSFTYSENNDQATYVAQELSIYWQDLFDLGIKRMKFVRYPTPIIWFVMDDGSLLSMVFKPEQQALGVTQHRLEDSSVLTIEVLPDTTSGFENLWVYHKRGSSNEIAIMAREYRSSFYSETKPINAPYLDHYLEYEGAAVDTVSGLTHLANEDVFFIADGRVGSGTVSSSGVLSIGFDAQKIKVGKSYDSYMTTVDAILPQTVNNDYFSRTYKEVKRVKIAMFDSNFCYAKPYELNSNTQEAVLFSLINNPTDSVVYDLQTSITEPLSIYSPTRPRAAFRLWIDQPLPLTITGIYFAATPSHI